MSAPTARCSSRRRAAAAATASSASCSAAAPTTPRSTTGSPQAAPVDGFIGFAIGRSIWWDPLKAYVDGKIERSAGARKIAENYLRFVAVYERAKAPRRLLSAEASSAMKMRQSLADWEQAFVKEISLDRHRRDSLRRTAEQRALKRDLEQAPQARLAALRAARAHADPDRRDRHGRDVPHALPAARLKRAQRRAAPARRRRC